MAELFQHLVNNLGYVIVITFFISRFKGFRQIIIKEKFKAADMVLLAVIFGTFGIMGTYVGIDVNGAIANTRNIGIMVGGILCGPFVGIVSSMIAAVHRIAIDIGGITAIPCAISTVVGGVLSGIIYKRAKLKNRWVWGLGGGILLESLSMLLILIMSKPFDTAYQIVKDIYIPMMMVNGGGIAIVILMIENIFEEQEEIGAKQSKLALEIANMTLPYFRDINPKSLENVCKIIKEKVGADAVAITDNDTVRAHVGLGDDHHIEGQNILTHATEDVIRLGKVSVLQRPSEIGCSHPDCPLRSAIVVPLKEQDSVIGALKIYYGKENAVLQSSIILAQGLSQLISTQMELSKIEKLRGMATRAELKALQAQINPHFMFNALNTIVSFIRIDPDKARALIIDLSTYLRHNIGSDEQLVDIKKEMEHVNAYVKIEQARFGDKLSVVWDIDDDIDIKIPSFLIQPLVENSIKHGILKGAGFGTVRINAKKTPEGVVVSIEDDGMGISKDVIDCIYSGAESSRTDKGGIGLSNVHNRIRLMYGKGVTIERLPKGTRISFVVK
ncbi:two-component system, LytT family, sensor kinase [Peptoclostridium litorale DSM 5388]|uniref:histidine kinase n=1 Tax=Peptoclostridium litorale DSM 5388 TaxID=1121324 RepID=A0A069R9Q9_PEPLI|nr:sensor histidine kinase [Peptoclostridium litorale]KDR93804.1 Two-component sensor kinase [Peptoclostridium litorale DSM 5388]SIN86166.1 two-component system, LytT family, sensor kinase [Peptoclostridium litorale DSM 5388]